MQHLSFVMVIVIVANLPNLLLQMTTSVSVLMSIKALDSWTKD